MGKLIVLVSGKGGTGKTTAAAAMGACLAYLGHPTVCVDGDVGLKNLDLVLGMAEDCACSFMDVLRGTAETENALIPCPTVDNLWLLSAPVSCGPEDIPAEALHSLLQSLRDRFDYVLVDAPAGIGPGFRLCAQGADTAVIVVNGEPASLRDAQRVTSELDALDIPSIRLLVNRCSRRNLRQMHASIDDYIDHVGAQLLGIISEDKSVPRAAAAETPLVLCDSRAAFQFMDAAKRLTGQRIPAGRL